MMSEQNLFYLYSVITLLLFIMLYIQSTTESYCQCRKGGIPDPYDLSRQQLKEDITNCRYSSNYAGVL